MKIDCVVFFITLNLISAWCNLSNDSSLLAIVKFKASLVLPLKAGQWGSTGTSHFGGTAGFVDVGPKLAECSGDVNGWWDFVRGTLFYFPGKEFAAFPLKINSGHA